MRPPAEETRSPADNGDAGNDAVRGGTVIPPAPAVGDDELDRQLRRMTRRGLACGGLAVVAGLAGWKWVVTRSQEDGLPWPLRRALEWNEQVARRLYRASRLSPEFVRSMAREPRVNGMIGLGTTLDPADWKLKVVGPSGANSPRSFTLDEIKALPRVEMTTELRCVEGWSELVYWAGARLADLASLTGLSRRPGGAGGLLDYAAIETPDRGYYVGLDMPSALHPQTLLCYEMNAKPLEPAHGAPLRLVIPLKYGIKNLKRIGTIRFTDTRPADFWAEQGYDWYAGH